MHLRIILILFLVLPKVAFSVSESNQKDYHDTINSLYNAFDHVIRIDIDSAGYVLDSATSLYLKYAENDAVLEPYSRQGYFAAIKGDYAGSLQLLDSAQQLILTLKDKSPIAYQIKQTKLNRYFGITYQKMDKLDICQKYYLNNVMVLDSLINLYPGETVLKETLAKTYFNLSVTQSYRERLDLMLKYNKKALEMYESLGMESELATIYFNFGNYYYLHNQLDSSILYYHKTIDVSQKYGLKELIFKSYNNFASIFLNNGNYELAEKYLFKSLHFLDSFKTTTPDRSFVYLQLGRLYLNQHKYDKAEPYTLEAYQLLTNGVSLEQLSYAFEDLTDLYKGKGQYAKALAYYEQFTNIKDSIYSIETEKNMQRMQAQYDLSSKETENRLLKEKSEKDDELLEIHKTNNILLGIALFLLVAFTSYGYFNYTKYKKLNRQLISINQDLEDSNREKDGLMSIVAHDLRSPLNKVKGLSNLIRMLGNLNKEQDEILSVIFKEIDNGNDLIRDLLDLSAYENADNLKTESFDLIEFLEKFIHQYQLFADSKRIKIQSDLADDISLKTDKEVLKRIMDNLLSNAVKFSRAGSEIFVKTYLSDKNTACISIRDNGPGFSEEDQKLMYKKFQRLSARPTNGESSTGLGLAIVKTLTKRINAKIELHTERNKGSEFIISIPNVSHPSYA